MRERVADVGNALVAAISAGTFNGEPIRVSQATGGEVRPPAVVLTSPSIGFHALGEGWITDRTEWRVLLYSSSGREPSVEVELSFLEAVLDALAADDRLGGLVSGIHPLGMEGATPVGAGVDKQGRPTPPTMYLRELRIEVHH